MIGHLVEEILCLLTLLTFIGAVRQWRGVIRNAADSEIRYEIRILRVHECVRTKLDERDKEKARRQQPPDIPLSLNKPENPHREKYNLCPHWSLVNRLQGRPVRTSLVRGSSTKGFGAAWDPGARRTFVNGHTGRSALYGRDENTDPLSSTNNNDDTQGRRLSPIHETF
jgi:hypothetical protein